jgi:hypothetical protein
VTRLARTTLVFVLLLLGTAVATAQEPVPPAEPRIHLGPFGLTPAFWLTTGYETNPGREGAATAAAGGYETVLVPQVDIWWRIGPVRFGTSSAIEFIRQPQQGEHSNHLNNFNGLGVALGESSLKLTGTVSHRDTYARPTGYEVGQRSDRLEDTIGGAAQWEGARTSAALEGRWLRINWDAAAEYQGSNLQESLNRDTKSVQWSFLYKLTPLTTASAIVLLQRDRFKYSPERDGDSFRVEGALGMGVGALFSGSAQVGYMHFTSPQSGLADFNGPVANVALVYASGSNRVVLNLYRDLFYSYDTSQGYYLLTSLAGSYNRSLPQRWEVKGFAGRHLLDYRQSHAGTAPAGTTRRTDLGAVLGYRPTPNTKVGVNTYWLKYSGSQNFTDLRIVAFIIYGSVWHQRLDAALPDDQ